MTGGRADAAGAPGPGGTGGTERAERALRAALSRADTEEFAPLDPADLALRAHVRGAAPQVPSVDTRHAAFGARPARRRAAQAVLAAAVVVAIAVPAGWLALNRAAPEGGIAATAGAERGAGANMDAQAGAGPAGAAEPAVPGRPGAAASDSGLGPASPGQRWESFLDVVVQVPEAWGYAQAPGSDWCAAGGPTPAPLPAPYVALNPNRPVLAIGCLDALPENRQQTHLEWRRAASGDRDGDVTRNGWVSSSRRVGSALVTVVHRPGDGVEAILGTARQVTVDHHGCAITGPALAARPAPAASDLPIRTSAASDLPTDSPTAAVTEAVLCQYDDATATPNLVTSTRLTGAAASGLAAAIDASPPAAPALESGCLPDDRDVTSVAVRLLGPGGAREVRLTVGGCRVPSLDDGRTTRTPTRAACTAVFTPPLARWVWGASSGGLCGPEG